MATHKERWDAYLVKDDEGNPTRVLRNNFGITNLRELERVERRCSGIARQEIESGEIQIPRTFDMAHLRLIHEKLFEQVYPWAGKVRTVAISKDFTDFALPGPEIAHAMSQAQKIIADTPWATLDQATFGLRMAQVFAWVNHAHPFREGNGRTTRQFMRHVAELAGRELHFERVPAQAWNQRSAMTSPDRGSHTPVPDAMVDVFKIIGTPMERPQSKDRPLIDQLRERAQQIQAERRDHRPSQPERRESRER